MAGADAVRGVCPLNESTTSAEFFEMKYRQNPDPWDFACSEYERSRYDSIIGALGERQFDRAFEPGCSVGELTWRLAQRCARVEAMDISATAIGRAKQRCHELSNVELRVGGLPDQMPAGEFDLIVFSEIGYYFDEDSLHKLGKMLVHQLSPCGIFLAAHWLGRSQDHLLSGDRVHEILGALSGLRIDQSARHGAFRLDRWTRV